MAHSRTGDLLTGDEFQQRNPAVLSRLVGAFQGGDDLFRVVDELGPDAQ